MGKNLPSRPGSSGGTVPTGTSNASWWCTSMPCVQVARVGVPSMAAPTVTIRGRG